MHRDLHGGDESITASLGFPDGQRKIRDLVMLGSDLHSGSHRESILVHRFHVPGRSEPMRGPAGYLEIIGMMRGGFPAIQWIVEGDKVAARFTMLGTHTGTSSASYRRGKQSQCRQWISTVCPAANSSKNAGNPTCLGCFSRSARSHQLRRNVA